MNYSRIILAGRLTRDPETRYTNDQKAIVKFGAAWDCGWGDKKQPAFVDVTFFGKRGESFAKFHRKGDEFFVDGELRMDSWQDKSSGEKRSKLYVVANEWQFVGGKKERAGSSEPTGSAGALLTDDDGVPF